MNRRLVLVAGAAVLAGGPASAQTGQQRAQPAQGQTGGQADWGDGSAVAGRSGVRSWAAQAADPAQKQTIVAALARLR
jgi:hypothetical protein